MAEKIQLFCLPYAGGSSNIFLDLKNKIDSNIEVIPIEYSGHGSRFGEKLYKNVDEAAEDISNTIARKIKGKYIIYGHSLGSIISLETTYKLIEKGIQYPQKIIFSSMRPPHLHYKNKKRTHLPKDKFMKEVFKLGQTPIEIIQNEEAFQIFSDIIYSDYKIYEEYKHKKDRNRISIPLIIMTGTDDIDAPKKDLLEWKQYTCNNFDLYTLKGNHFFLFDDNEEFLKIIKELCL